MTLNGFNKIAFIYDRLAGIVFGESIKNSQRYFIDRIPAEAKILILGGGTGWLLAEILMARPAREIWYVEASSKMIEKSKGKIPAGSNVYFIHGTENNIPPDILFDVVITNFYVDLFTDKTLPVVVTKIISTLHEKSFLLVTDFVDGGKWWHKAMLKIMYTFFRFTSGIQGNKLPNWNDVFQQHHLKKQASKLFYSGFIEAGILVKQDYR